MSDFVYDPQANDVSIAGDVSVKGKIDGKNNTVNINAESKGNFNIAINGDNNIIEIKCGRVSGLRVVIGSNVRAHNTKLSIGSGFSNEGGGEFYLYNSRNLLEIGENCMFSKNVKIRCGDSPHLIFEKESGVYLDTSEGVFIGNHVWVGEDVYITKKVTLPDECIVGARSVVTRRFNSKNAVIAGNPAKIVKEGVQWIRNPQALNDHDSKFKQSYMEFKNQ